MSPEQALSHLFELALEVAVPARVHNTSKEAFNILRKIIEHVQPTQPKPELKAVEKDK